MIGPPLEKGISDVELRAESLSRQKVLAPVVMLASVLCPRLC